MQSRRWSAQRPEGTGVEAFGKLMIAGITRTAGQAGVVDQAWVSGAGPETEGLAVSDEPLRILGSTSVETSCLASFFWLIRPSGEGNFLRFLTDRFRQKKTLVECVGDTNVSFCLELREKKLKESFVEGENK